MWHKLGTWMGLLLLFFILAGCTVTESTFVKTAGNVGSAFAAAETTLSYAHQDKVTYAYASSSFENFQSELSGTDQTLAAQKGVDSRTLQGLLALYASAMRVIDAPCLSDACNWSGQVEVLKRASLAFLKAANA